MGARHSRATWTNQVLLAGVSGVFPGPGYSSFRPTYRSIRLNTSEKVQVGKDQEKAQSEKKDSHSKDRGGKKNKLTIRYLYHETYRKPNEQLFSQ